MMHWEWPWALLLLPLPWLVRRFLPPFNPAAGALRIPFLADLSPFTQEAPSLQRRLPLLLLLAWFLLILAAARPQWLGDPLLLPVSGRNLMLAVDLSESMEMTDFYMQGRDVNRLEVIQSVASRFIERREGDRLGLILFGDEVYLQAPLTFDREAVKGLLQEAVIGLAGKKTAIGDAIGLAVKKMRDLPQEGRVLVLLTDGANTAGEVTPLQAAELASRERLRIHTIGIGAERAVVRDLFGARTVNPSAQLDEKTLTHIAESTGGRYFRARDSDELEEIYRLIDQLEPVAGKGISHRPRRSLFFWPLGGSLLIAFWLAALPGIRQSLGRA